jgi:colanic acid/amylovoran biosynthesis glycosyltransferase
MDKIRIVHSRHVWLKQSETWLYNQIRHIDDRFETHVICSTVENLDQFRVDNIHQLQASSIFERCSEGVLKKVGIQTYYRPFLRALKEIGPSILHSHFGHFAWSEMPAAKRAGIKHIVTFYGHDVNRLPFQNPSWRERYLSLFKHVALVLCEGPFMAESVRKLGCPGEKVRVHHLGTRVEDIPFRPRTWKRDEKLRVLIVAPFKEKKGIPYALEALSRIRDRAQVEITIIGEADHENRSQIEKRKILDTIDRCGLDGGVRLLGFQPYSRVFRESYEHHLFISPSVTASDRDTEGGVPMTLIEMAATGMPVLSTRHCDIPEVIQDGESGFLVGERDVDGLVDSLQWIIEHADEWGHFVKHARKRIEKEYNAVTQGIRLSEIYKEVAQ